MSKKTKPNKVAVERYVKLNAQAYRLKTKLKAIDAEVKDLEKTFTAWADSSVGVASETVLNSPAFAIEIGARGLSTKLKNTQGISKLLNKKQTGLSKALMSFSITDLRKVLTEEELAQFTTETHKNSRSFTIQAR